MSTPKKAGTPSRILIVDDDQLVADTLTLVFSKKGFDVRTCYSAEDALPCARAFLPDLLLCDVLLPGTDGYTLVRQISGELPACQVLIFTGTQPTVEVFKSQTRSLPRPPAILTKPCQPSELLREVNSLLRCA
ncbi:response regulator transcription factor [Edaphobacter flagellatus]|uniref:response regulator transcription factor n=1 Tax=Edaphobacter flagellatus TaxID=1933044 RepID=UPI0021B29B3C|nr:response regulator [Edaphobacter flagellatus]